MLKKIIKKTYYYFRLDLPEHLKIRKSIKNERLKFKNDKRVAIYSKMQLTTQQKQAIDKLYKDNYGKKIPYVWHRYYSMYTGNFDVNYFPELLYIPLFERIMNQNIEYTKVMEDKNFLTQIAKSGNVRMPETIISKTKGIYRDVNYNQLTESEAKTIIDNVGEAFFKPSVDTCSGVGCKVVNFINGIETKIGQSVDDFLLTSGDDFVLQQKLVCHESVAKLHKQSVNTFRIITYRWKDEFVSMPVIMRIGQGDSVLDNAHAGGMFIAVDDDGSLHDTAFTEFCDKFSKHPTSHINFVGYKIEMFPKVLSTAIKMHKLVPQLGVVNWDFTIDESGEPVLIEANCKGGSIWMAEMAHGVGVFGDRTAEVLRWIKTISKVPVKERNKYAFGEILKEKI